MIDKTEYESLLKHHELASKTNDYSKMIMIGDSNHKLIKEYEQENVCKHIQVESIQGGQIEKCLDCGKIWS